MAFFFCALRMINLLTVPQYYPSVLQFAELGIGVPFVTLSLSVLTFSIWTLSFVVQELFSQLSVLLLDSEGDNGGNKFRIFLHCHLGYSPLWNLLNTS